MAGQNRERDFCTVSDVPQFKMWIFRLSPEIMGRMTVCERRIGSEIAEIHCVATEGCIEWGDCQIAHSGPNFTPLRPTLPSVSNFCILALHKGSD